MRIVARILGVALLVAAAGAMPAARGLVSSAAATETVAPTATGSTSFRIVGAVTTPLTINLQGLQARPKTTLDVFFHNTASGHAVAGSYRGVLLWTLLQEAGIETNPAVSNGILRRTVTLTASDGYVVVLGAGEIAPSFGGQQAIIAFAKDGAPLPAQQGFARLIVPGDKTDGRNIFSITRIEVR